MGNFEERFKQLEQAVAKLSGCATGQDEEYTASEKPSSSDAIIIDDCHYECEDYEFEIDVEGTTVYVCKDFKTDCASFNLCFQDVEVMTVEDLIKIRKWVAWTCKERGL